MGTTAIDGHVQFCPQRLYEHYRVNLEKRVEKLRNQKSLENAFSLFLAKLRRLRTGEASQVVTELSHGRHGKSVHVLACVYTRQQI